MVCFFYILPTYRQNKNKNKKKWWAESDFKAPNLPLSLRLKGLDLDPKFIFAKTKKQLGRILCGTFDFILNMNAGRHDD
jgi:hypothetical protein